ncbi:MAG: endonuclease VII domain-containing protein [Bacteroidia bacterium]|nr:endonuclease VII domain-containing protein [Bacteroidia bacterium]
MKVCSKCNIEKELTEYHKRSNRPCGVRSQCKSCYKEYPVKLKRRDGYMRQYDLNKSYGISLSNYNEILEKQNGKCAICNKTPKEKNMGRKKNLCVDHCHTTGNIRGLLCDTCNRGIGLLDDNKELLNNALLYLSR